jgi:hypothetical protein
VKLNVQAYLYPVIRKAGKISVLKAKFKYLGKKTMKNTFVKTGY